jgi:hypothetical protein
MAARARLKSRGMNEALRPFAAGEALYFAEPHAILHHAMAALHASTQRSASSMKDSITHCTHEACEGSLSIWQAA